MCQTSSIYKVLSVWALGFCSAKLETMMNMILTFVVPLVVSGLLVSSARVSEADANHDAILLNEVKSLLCPESGPSFLRGSTTTVNATRRARQSLIGLNVHCANSYIPQHISTV